MLDMHPAKAYELLWSQKDAILIDVRSEVEYLFVGHAETAIHIPWYQEPGWEINQNFIEQIQEAVGHHARPIVFICRNGNRSKEAGRVAEQHGFTQIINVLHGFEGDLDASNRRSLLNGWRYEGLPWEQC